jgi:hypothetical protein
MTENAIKVLREKMHKLITDNAPYSEILKISQRLDLVILRAMKAQLRG